MNLYEERKKYLMTNIFIKEKEWLIYLEYLLFKLRNNSINLYIFYFNLNVVYSLMKINKI